MMIAGMFGIKNSVVSVFLAFFQRLFYSDIYGPIENPTLDTSLRKYLTRSSLNKRLL